MPAVRTVASDRTLPHQIVLLTPRRPGSGKHEVHVTCNCRIRSKQKPFGRLGPDGDSVWAIYHAGQHDTPLTELVSGERRDYRVA